MDGWWAASYAVLWGLVLVLCLVVVALARQIGTLHLRLGPRGALEMDDEGPPLGEPLAAIEAETLDGKHITVGDASQLILFSSPGCRMCEEILPALPVLARSRELDPIVVTDVDREETALAYSNRKGMAIVSGVDITATYEIPGTPFVLVVDGDGIVRAKGTVNNLEQMEGLLDSAAERQGARLRG